MTYKRHNIFQKIWWLPLGCFLVLLGSFLVLVVQTRKPPQLIQSEIIIATSPSIVQDASDSLPAAKTPDSDLQTDTSTPTSLSSPPTNTPISVSPSSLSDDKLTSLQQVALWLVNETRENYNLDTVKWNPLAAEIGRQHALEMSANCYLSHWNMQGLGPDMRYSFAGGTDVVQENVFNYWRSNSDGSPAPIDDLEAVVREAHEAWMNSAGHRDNILNPAHTHLGVGIAYNPDTGYMSLAQEFTNHYVEIG